MKVDIDIEKLSARVIELAKLFTSSAPPEQDKSKRLAQGVLELAAQQIVLEKLLERVAVHHNIDPSQLSELAVTAAQQWKGEMNKPKVLTH